MTSLLTVLLLIAPSAGIRHAQAPSPSLFEFFTGSWGCAGAFSNGKPLEADMTFALKAGGKWLMYEHADRAPGIFKAAALWGTDRVSGKTISLMTDSGGGARLFTSDGWQDGKIVFTADTLLKRPSRGEHFVFARETPTQFRMTWETSADGSTWKMGDYVVCQKNPARP